ncbi:unnamed protein product [Effrenium voratum]|nr:unnamed protein product [Effrenium voratum]
MGRFGPTCWDCRGTWRLSSGGRRFEIADSRNRWSLLLQVADQGCLLPEPPRPRSEPISTVPDSQGLDLLEEAGFGTQGYCDFLADPGVKCPRCWRVAQHCCCESMRPVQLRPRILVLFHHEELGQHSATNTAVLLTLLGAELFCCGLPEHDQKLTELLREDVSGTVVLFPSDLALPAAELAALGDTEPRVRRVVVLDGGWAQCKKMNQWLDPALPRCFVNASREEFGGTRRYRGITNRVQTAGAFVALMRDLEEEPETVAAISESLGAFMDSFVAQMHEGRLKVL